MFTLGQVVPFVRNVFPCLPDKQTPIYLSDSSLKAASSRKPAFLHAELSCTCPVLHALSSLLQLELLEGGARAYSRGIHGAGSTNLHWWADCAHLSSQARGAPHALGFPVLAPLPFPFPFLPTPLVLSCSHLPPSSFLLRLPERYPPRLADAVPTDACRGRCCAARWAALLRARFLRGQVGGSGLGAAARGRRRGRE